MLVEDPRHTLNALCSLGGIDFDRAKFKLTYEKEVDRLDDPISREHADTHFYTPKIYGLYDSGARRGTYRLSFVAKQLCELLKDPNKQDEYRKLLGNLLLTNDEKGELFRGFVEFVKKKKTRQEIYDKFEQITGRTLIAWSKDAGLIETDEDEDHVWALARDAPKPSPEQFKDVLLSTYKELEKSEVFGIRLGGFAADATWDLTQFFPSIFGSTLFHPFVTTLFVASMTPAGVAILEVRRLRRQYENLSRRELNQNIRAC